MIEYYTKCNPDIWFYDDVTTFTFIQINNSTKEYCKGEMQDQFEITELAKTINFALSQTMNHDVLLVFYTSTKVSRNTGDPRILVIPVYGH